MKFAICLKGISYCNMAYSSSCHGKRDSDKYTTDCRLYYDNFIEMIINPIKEKGYDVDVFISTYYNEHIDQILKLYNLRSDSVIGQALKLASSSDEANSKLQKQAYNSVNSIILPFETIYTKSSYRAQTTFQKSH